MRFVGRDAEQPGLELGIALKRGDIFDYRQKRFLTNLLDIFACKVGRKLKNETAGGRVMPLEDFVPGCRVTAPASGH